jgi:hypothetical protein
MKQESSETTKQMGDIMAELLKNNFAHLLNQPAEAWRNILRICCAMLFFQAAYLRRSPFTNSTISSLLGKVIASSGQAFAHPMQYTTQLFGRATMG